MSDHHSQPLILAAMEMEARAILKELAKRRMTVSVETIGIGACRLPPDLSGKNASYILLAGIGGGLDPSLQIGDVIVDDPQNLAAAAKLPRGKIATVKNVIATVEGKADLRAKTGAAIGDMENSIVRQAAEKAGIPFLGLRAVSDTADQAIDPEILSLVDDLGRPRMMAAMALIAKRPALMGQLNRLRDQSNRAVEALVGALTVVLEAVKL